MMLRRSTRLESIARDAGRGKIKKFNQLFSISEKSREILTKPRLSP
jgi:hypothetical protein